MKNAIFSISKCSNECACTFLKCESAECFLSLIVEYHITAFGWKGSNMFRHLANTAVRVGVRRLSLTHARSGGDRLVLDPKFAVPNRPGEFVRIEVAEYSDRHKIIDFSDNNFSVKEPMLDYHKTDPRRFREYVVELTHRALRTNYSVLAMKGDRIIGVVLSTTEVVDMTVIDKCHGMYDRREEAYTVAVVEYAYTMLPNYLPRESDHMMVGHGEIGSVNKDYDSNGLCTKLIVEGAKEMARDGYRYYYALSTAAATNHINIKVGMKSAWHAKYKGPVDETNWTRARMGCLIVIVDCNACSWGALHEQWQQADLLKRAIGALVVLANCHLSLSAQNRVHVVTAGVGGGKKVVFSSDALPPNRSAAQLIDEELRRAVEHSARSADAFVHTNYAAAFALAVCHFNRFKRDNRAGRGRIVVLNLSGESHAEQAKLMNLFLGAQQQDLHVHVCSLARTNPVMRQASDITGGVHRQLDNIGELPDFLIRYCLGNTAEAQDAFTMRAVERIDYQASCYCHDRPVSLGFVCSVCLAVHCKYVPICAACGTAFKVVRKKDLPENGVKA